MPETRKHERLPISLRVRFRSATLDEFVEKYAQNISHGGLFIQSKSPMPVGTLIKFEFQLTDESKLITGVGRIVWSRSDGHEEDAPTGMGVKFIKVDPENRERIAEIVERRGGGEGRFDEEVGSPLPEPQLMPTIPPKGLADGSVPPPNYQVRHPDLHGLSDSDTIHAPQRTNASSDSAGKAPREARPFLAAALTNKEETSATSRGRSEALPAGLAPDAEADALSEPPISFSEPPAESEPESASKPASIRPAISGETLDGPPDSQMAAAIEDGRSQIEESDAPQADAFERPTSKRGIAAIESALADSLDEEFEEPTPAQPSGPLLDGSQDSAFGIGVDGASVDAAPDPALLSDPVAIPAKQSRLLPIMLALVLVALVGAMLFFWFNQNTLGTDASEDDEIAAETVPTEATPTTAALPAATIDAGDDSGHADSGQIDGSVRTDAAVAEDATLIKTQFSSNVKDAEFSYGSETFEQEVELPEGIEVTILATAPGYKEATHSFVPGPDQTQQRIVLEPLPHVVKVTSSPPGATVVIAGKRAEAPAEIVFDSSPGAAWVVGTRRGHLRQRVRLDAEGFTQEGEQMVQSIEIELRPRPKPRPRPRPANENTTAGDTNAGGDSAGGDSEPPVGDVPDNPF